MGLGVDPAAGLKKLVMSIVGVVWGCGGVGVWAGVGVGGCGCAVCDRVVLSLRYPPLPSRVNSSAYFTTRFEAGGPGRRGGGCIVVRVHVAAMGVWHWHRVWWCWRWTVCAWQWPLQEQQGSTKPRGGGGISKASVSMPPSTHTHMHACMHAYRYMHAYVPVCTPSQPVQHLPLQLLQ